MAERKKTTLLFMAAGMGSRFGSLKQLALLGPHRKTLLHYSIYDAVHAGFDKVVFIIRRSFEQEFRKAVGHYSEAVAETCYCFQEMEHLPGGMPPVEREKPWGTAHAIWSARDAVNEPFVAINADDFYGRDAFVKMHAFVAGNEDERCFSLAGYRLAATLSENGTVSDPALCIKCCACVKECPEGARTFDTPFTAILYKNFSARKEPESFLA